MATLIAYADGNLTGASTFCATVTSTGALALRRFSFTSISSASSATSATFTVTNGAIIDAVMLWIRSDPGTNNGTFKVDLQKGGVSQASVTVNKVDLPIGNSSFGQHPVLFKFTGTATGDGGSNWTLVLTTTGTGYIVTCSIDATGATNISRALRTTTAATAAAADNLFIVGELTGAGTHNSRTVTMDLTAATVYGNGSVNSTTVYGGLIAVNNWATLSYGTTAATNYILRIAGDLLVGPSGTLNIGSSGAEIPRTSTAVLEFQPVSADGDFGLQVRDGTFNAAGLSRTSGKSVVQCKLTADVTLGTQVWSSGSAVAGSAGAGQFDATGTSLLGNYFADNTTAGVSHYLSFSLTGAVTGTSFITFRTWIARGNGLNNRYVRMLVSGSSSSGGANQFYADIDLQAGTIGAITALGTATATSASIVASGTGYVVTIVGKYGTLAGTAQAILASCAVAGTLAYVGNTTVCFYYDHTSIQAASSIPDTTFNVDTDTGWLNGDVVCVASTTQTASDCELFSLNANASASSFVSALTPEAAIHSGTSPTQAEIGLLTRNVKIRSTSTTLMAYVYCTATSTITVSWVEFYRLGTASSPKHGIEIDSGGVSTTGVKNITYCSLHNFDANGLYGATGVGNVFNLTFSNNVLWYNIASTSVFINISGGNLATPPLLEIDSNLFMRGNGVAVNLGDIGCICTNNTVVGAADSGFLFRGDTIGTFDGNTAHSCTGSGLETQTGYVYGGGTVSNFTAWRCGASGVLIDSNSTSKLVFDGLLIFGCTAASGSFLSTGGDHINIFNAVIAGDTTYPSAYGIGSTGSYLKHLNLVNVDMSGVGSIYAPHATADFLVNNTHTQGVANNCKFGAPTLFSAKTWNNAAYISFQKFNQVAGDHRTEMKYGTVQTDDVLYNTAAPSMRMMPTSPNNKLESAPKGKGILVAVENGATTTVSVWVRKEGGYSGSQPRLIARANAAVGIDEDTVLATDSSVISGALWVPTDLGADVWAWWKFNEMSQADTVVVPSVTDASGNSRTLTTVGSPTAKAAAQNGLKALDFAGGTKYGTFASSVAFTSGAFFAVNKGMSGNRGGICDMGTDAVALNHYGFGAGNTVYSDFLSTTRRDSGDLSGAHTSWHQSMFWSATNDWGFGLDGVNKTTYSVNVVAGRATSYLAADGNDTAWLHGGEFGEVVILNNKPTTLNRQRMEGYLAHKWDLESRLDAEHVYKLVAPVTGSSPGWIQLSGVTPMATDDGAVEVIVDCDGGGGWINIDDWAVNGTVVCDQSAWFNGLPIAGGGGGGASETFHGRFS